MVRLFLLVAALLSGLSSLVLTVVLLEAPGREVEGLTGMLLLLVLAFFVASAGALLWLLPADRFPGLHMAAAALWLSPFALFGGGGWTGAAVLVLGGLAYAAWRVLASLTRRRTDYPPG